MSSKHSLEHCTDLTEVYDFLDEKPDAAEAVGFFTIDDEDFDI